MRVLQRGDPVPHFRVTTIEGLGVAYSTVWQHRILVLVTLPVSDPDPPELQFIGRGSINAGGGS